MKVTDYGIGLMAAVAAFIAFVVIVAQAALPLLADTAQRIQAIGR